MNVASNEVISEDIKSQPKDILNRVLTASQNNTTVTLDTFVGFVVDNDDPKKLGRCKVNVLSVYDGVPTEDLPWAAPEFGFVGSTMGSFIVPPVGAIVNVYFNRGEIYLPVYTTKVATKKNLPSRKDIDYPDTMIFFETDNGDSFEINRKRETAQYTHSSGTTITIAKDGSVKIDSVANLTTDHDELLTVNGNMVIPAGHGPLCAIPICPFSGALHTGTVCTSVNTVSDGNLFDGVSTECNCLE
jgi:hypothetical protein